MPKWNELVERLKASPAELRYETMRRLLEYYGYNLANTHGSHFKFRKVGRPFITVVVHHGKASKWYVKSAVKQLLIYDI